MKWTEIRSGQTHRAFTTLMNALGNHAAAVVKRINTDPAFVAHIIGFMVNDDYEPSTSQELAREIMGKNFFGIEEAQKHFGVTLSKRQLAYMAAIPFSAEVLTECKDTHILVAYVPISIVDVRTKTASMKLPAKHRMFYQQDWCDKDKFDKAGVLEWHLIRKTSVPDSKSKTWQEQRNLFDSKIDEIPEANLLVYTIIGYFLNTGERLFEKERVRTRTLGLGGGHVSIGDFGPEGLFINNCWDDDSSNSVGLSVVRRQIPM